MASEGPDDAASDADVRRTYLRTELQRRLIRYIQRHPGITPTELVSKTGTGWGAAIYNLRKLEEAGAIRSQRDGRSRRYYMQEGWKPTVLDLRKFVSLTALDIARAIAERPGITAPELQRICGASKRALYYHLARLTTHGLVQADPGIRYRRSYRATPRLLQALAQLHDATDADFT